MMNASGYAAHSSTTPLKPYSFQRRDPGPKDVVIDIEYCGVCHSDIHQVRDEWGGSIFPMVPGHEIVGTVNAVGKDVKRFKPGDIAAVGVMVDSCRECASCRRGLEQYCEKGMVGTYGAKDRYGDITYGGYSDVIVTDEHFVYGISPKLDKAGGGAVSLRRNHDLLAAETLGSWSREEGWRGGTGRPGPHGAEVCP